MSEPNAPEADASLDLVIERLLDVPIERVWEAWTDPDKLRQWFVPAPWSITDCAIDLRPGGAFRTTMCSPDGEEFPSEGCILEVVPHERLVFTDALLPGYRPSLEPFFTAVITMERRGDQTLYTARAMHADEEARERHEEMGFHEGWGKTIDQLVDLARS